MPVLYTEWCPEAQAMCPGGPDNCLLQQNPLDPAVCFALPWEGEGEDPREGEPPG